MGWLGIAGAIVLIVLAVVNQLLTRKKIPDMQAASARSHGLAEETRRHIEIVRAHGMGGQIVPRWNEMREKGQGFAMAHSDLSGAFQASTKAFRLFLQSAMLALGAWLVLQAELTAGAMIAGSIILGRALAPIEQSLSQLKPLQGAGAAWRSLGDLLAQTPPEAKKDRTATAGAAVVGQICRSQPGRIRDRDTLAGRFFHGPGRCYRRRRPVGNRQVVAVADADRCLAAARGGSAPGCGTPGSV